ncbi:MlaE family ABC transporter permease [Tepidicella xavieri]|jgi:phospholipid/cholesterol/gamma-HCH transport system permease protein|uniref:Phospholipid/cholesterol/gamma-HCH transport system permease protein n=1 Tax=Tepidicella xavieri TaxID=360241 RepID=A0A4R6U909_9BURK|nr:ABC transporter permease [Tepidicella xavieri]TDQ43080.1 phospholipid/cholesterol/gamma-HCH transport system permease protein [Tepidicella xavieri]
MDFIARLHAALLDLGRGALRWFANGWRIVHLGAVILVLAVSPSSYRRGFWPLLAQQLYGATMPVLLWFTVLSALLGLVLIRIVVVTALSYGLSQYAVDMVVRVLVLELIPLGAALFVALRITIPQGAELMALRRQGAFEACQAQGRDVLHWFVLPRALAGMFSVFMLAAVSCLVALVLAYLNIYGFNPWAIGSYTRIVGQVFNPVVTLIFTFKTFFFALTVALIPLASSLYAAASTDRRAGGELQSLVRMFLALLAIELVSLMGNYY